MATAAALLILLLVPDGSLPETDTGTAGRIVPWVTPQLLRGGSTAATLEISRETVDIILPIRIPPRTQTGTPAILELYGPDEEQLSRLVLDPTDLASATVIVRLTRQEEFDSGRYRVLFTQETEPQITTSESYFELVVN